MAKGGSSNRQGPLRALALLLGAVLAAAALTLGLMGDCAAAERRVALVIGNSSYKNPALDIPNARNDAEDVAAALAALGFEVLLQTDVDLSGASKAIQQFARLSVGADATLFYFAGHAVQYQGHNYLLPVDAEIKDEISLPFETIAVDNVRAVLDRSSGVKIMVLDACRTNPISERLAKLASSGVPIEPQERTRGLERVDKSEGIIVAYATSPGDVALDGQDRNSPFTKAFLRRLNEPGLEIEMMFRRIANDVRLATSGRQRPETYVSLVSEYYLNQNDKIAWDKIKGTDDPAVLNDFLEHFPSSFYAIEARYRLQALERAIAEAKERALREAEIARREKELAAEEAAARLKAEQACSNDRAALSAAAPRDAESLRRLAANACDEVKAAAQKRLGELEATLAAEAEACRRDEAVLAAVGAHDLDRLRDLAQTASCASVRAAASDKAAVAETLLAKEAETCQREDGELKSLVERGDADALRRLSVSASCAAVKTAAAQRLKDVEAALAREDELCRRDEAQWSELSHSGSRADVETFRARAECAGIASAVDGRLAELRALCRSDDAALAAIGPRDADGLRGFIGAAQCDEVRAAARQRLATLETSLAHEAEACRRDAAQFKDAPSGDGAALTSLRQRVECPSVVADIDRALGDLKTACAREQGEFAANGNDREAVKNFFDRAACADVKAAAGAKLAKLEADEARSEEVCRREDIELTALKRQGADARDRLVELKRRLSCARLRPDVEAALEQLPPPPEFNTRAQIRSAQTQLQRLGCLGANDSGRLDSKTQEALSRYFDAKGDAAPALADLKITDGFVSKLEGEKPSLCAPPNVAAPEPSDDNKSLRRPKANAARLPKAEPRQQAAEPRQKAARPAPEEKPVRLTRPLQPERPQAPAQATANGAPGRPASSAPLGVGF